MRVARIGQIHRYPVKSMAGESLPAVDLAERGVAGDRVWAVRDEVRGGIRGAKKIPALMNFTARLTQPAAASGSAAAEILFPDGSRAATGDADINDRLSAAVDHAVTLWPLLPANALDHYRRGAPTHEDFEQEMREIFGRTADEALPDISIFPPEVMEFESPPGTYFDAFPLLLLTDTSLATMAQRSPDSNFAVGRFRPNFVLTDVSSDEPFPEIAWRDRRLRVGEATVRVTVECPRCVMVTLGHHGLAKDPAVMRALVREAGGNLGAYATVETPGQVRVGDAVELID